ncbi:hypothetical protein [Hyphomonas sp.]|uniref:hypothetical protein n=1 Tax=Hyphomonas sp. TaxID=87 RepID=UPI0025C4FEA2|nr:hypothetical protein [Hyphomonas sp.]
MKYPFISMAVLLGVAGCQSGAPASGNASTPDPLKATLSGDACPDMGQKAYFFWMEPRSVEPGDAVALFPYWTDMPGGYNRLPPGCLGDLGVYPEGTAAFSRQEDGLAIATIGPDVQAGTRLRLDGAYNGHGLTGLVEVFRAADNPLVGTWRQEGRDCVSGSAVQELVFTGGGDFSVTWTPFEVYKDYWGSYTFDAQTGAISLTVESGNQLPEDVMPSGIATVSDGRLVFDGVSLGTPRSAAEACHGAFTK